MSDDAGDEAGQATSTRLSKIQVNWIPERTWLKTEISDAAVDSARESIPDVVSAVHACCRPGLMVVFRIH